MELYEVSILGKHIRSFVEKQLEPLLEKYGLRFVELDLLLILNREKDVNTAREIMKHKKISKAYASKSIENLRNLGYISIVEDKKDHRVMRLRLCESAYQVIKDANACYDQCRDMAVASISKEELEATAAVFHKIAKNLDHYTGY